MLDLRITWLSGRRRLVGSFWHGSMANAMARAIGAQAAFPRRQVISLSGDGGFTAWAGSRTAFSSGEDRHRWHRPRGKRDDFESGLRPDPVGALHGA